MDLTVSPVSVGVGALQKSASQSGDATEVETLARFNGS